MNKVWKKINGYDDYEVSTDGEIRNGSRYFKFTPDKDGYSKTALRDKDGNRKYLRVHRIVAMTFIDNPNELPIVNHKNGIKDDNRVENLEWCTISQNTKHGFDVLGRQPNKTTCIPIKIINIETEEEIHFEDMSSASKFLGITVQSVASYFKRKEKLEDKATILKKYYGEKL